MCEARSGTNFIDAEELEGRTVRRVCQTESSVLITFTDGTYTVISDSGGYYVDEGRTEFVEPDKWDLEKLKEMGVEVP